VLIVEDYIPEYRRRFFETLHGALRKESIELRIAVGGASATLAARGDAASGIDFVRPVRTRSYRVAGRTLSLRSLGDLGRSADLVVIDQALRNLDAYRLLLGRRRGPKVALWGHGVRTVKPASGFERRLSKALTNRADWFFAYTEGGAASVTRDGFPGERVTVVLNTIDTAVLSSLRSAITDDVVDRARSRLELPPRNVCLFIGALDPSKRIPFLLDAAGRVADRVPGFTLVVAGDGPDRELVERAAVSHPWLRFVGRASDPQKAELAAVADLVLMPGRVGLVAIDSFVLQTPIVTTRWPYHAPEFEYLEDGRNAVVAPDTVDAFAAAVVDTLTSRERLAGLEEGCASAAPLYSLDTMVENFTHGLVSALTAPPRRGSRA
jgi:glycosyltransferase involved in cell wall biosynthesis